MADWDRRLRQWLGLPRPLPADYGRQIADAVERVEANSAAEVVVVVRRASGNYRDVDFALGAAVAWLFLLLVLFSPMEVHPLAVPVEVALVFAAFAWLSAHTAARRWFSSRQRQLQQVHHSAQAAFVSESVIDTAARTGILLYWSRLEQRLDVLADLAIHRAVPAEEWNAWLYRVRTAERNLETPHWVELLDALGQMLAKHLPVPEAHERHLPNEPRVEA